MKKHPLAKGINLRVTTPVHDKLKELADEKNQHLAEYIRDVLNNHVEMLGVN